MKTILKQILLLTSILLLNLNNLISQEINFNKKTQTFTLKNDLFSRQIKIDNENHAFYTISLKIADGDYDFWREGNTPEFSFLIDGKAVSGAKDAMCFDYVSHEIKEGEKGSGILTVHLKGYSGSNAKGIGLTINYTIYPDVAVVRKNLEITNNNDQEVSITDLVWESLLLDPWGGNSAHIYGNYGRYWYKSPYIGGRDDPAILVKGAKGSFILGNESPGIMKYTTVYHNANKLVNIGMNPSSHDFAFKKYLKKGETFKTPNSFIILSSEEVAEDAFEKDLGHFIREYMGVKLFEREKRPLFLYNTWYPFTTNINEEMIMDIADSLEGTGVEYLILDDGWQDKYGDWNNNPKKFPNGLKPVCDHIREKGMKPGIWISLTSVEKDSKAFKEHEDHIVKDMEGNNANIHGWANDLKFQTANILSPWYDYMKSKIIDLVQTNGFEYIKIDLAMVKSAYIMETERTGSYDTTEYYKGREEFLYLSYKRLMDLYDELAEECPELIVDCTFEIWGDWHIIDYALIQHADVDWICNFPTPPPEGSREIRNLQWHHSLVAPASCMVIGNQSMEMPNHHLSYISNLGNMPIMLGDPRKLTKEDKAKYKKYYDWFRSMEEKYEITKYHQTSNIFPKPEENNWDGFARFNTEKQGGILCVFRNNSPDAYRMIKFPWALEDAKYKVTSIDTDDDNRTYTGKELIEKGINVYCHEIHSVRTFSIEIIK